MPLLIGVISSSILSGQIVARTGKYKVLLLGAVTLLGIGSYLFTHLGAATNMQTIWVWQFVLGVGIGPTLAVFTIVVQNAVPFRKLGVATSNLTFFRQIGGTIGLSIAGTVFGSQLTELIPRQIAANDVPGKLLAAGVPPSELAKLGDLPFDPNQIVGVGGDLVGSIEKLLVAAFGPAVGGQVAPVAQDIATSIYEAISFAIASVFWLGVVAAVIAFVGVLVIRELPLRTSFGPVPARPTEGEVAPPGSASAPAAASAPATAASPAAG
jgi:MFS family permease